MDRSEEKSMAVAEAAREQVWRGRSILKDIFLGDFELSLVHPYPAEPRERPEFRAFRGAMERFLAEKVDPDRIDREGEYPKEVLEGLRALGAFGMKIKRRYGGLELSQVEYAGIMELLGSHDANLVGLLSAHQSIGVPQPLQLFGSDFLKEKYLPRCAQGAISAFALTEPDVGSDPARLATTARLSADGSHYVLDGVKLWCTNGTLAELLVVMARDPKNDRISAFVVEAGWEGVQVEHRCRFMGLRALSNAVISFEGVKVPKENLIGKEGAGLKIALTTLNAGRLSIPAACVGASKRCLEIVRKWSGARSQWGQEIGKHEAVALKLADLSATVFAMETVSDLCQVLAQTEGVDIRLEAAMAKEWCAQQGIRVAHEALQIRGGRGYETESSLRERGEAAVSLERIVRDARVNTIFEGSSEVMHLFMAREAVDTHLKVAGPLVLGKGGLPEKVRALPAVAAFYARWYPTRWITRSGYLGYGEFGDLARYLRFVDRTSKRIARETFHGMVRYQAGLAKRQGFLFRIVDAGMELFAMAAVCARVQRMREAGEPGVVEAGRLAQVFCAAAERRVEQLLGELWFNEDRLRYSTGRAVLSGLTGFLEDGAVPAGITVEDLVPPSGRRKKAPRAA